MDEIDIAILEEEEAAERARQAHQAVDAARRADCAARYASALDAVRAATVQLNKLADELSTP